MNGSELSDRWESQADRLGESLEQIEALAEVLSGLTQNEKQQAEIGSRTPLIVPYLRTIVVREIVHSAYVAGVSTWPDSSPQRTRKRMSWMHISLTEKGLSPVGRPSSIIGKPVQERIDELLDRGETYEKIRAATGVSFAALSRYKTFRKSHVARVIDNEPNVFDLITRLQHAADDARDARRGLALLSPAARARAIRVEADLIEKLLDALGVDDVLVMEQLERAFSLVVAVRDHVRHDQHPADLIARIREIPGLEDVATALDGQMEKTR